MKLSLAVLCALVAVASAHGWNKFNRGGGYNTRQRQQQPQWNWNPMSWTSYGKQGWGSTQEAKKDECGCAGKRISIEDKLNLIAKDNDRNGDGVVDSSDVIYDVSLNYDKNNDGLWSESECVQTYACRFGDTEAVSTFICASIFGGGEEMNIKEDLNASPFREGIPLDAFLEKAKSRYTRFFNDRCVNTNLTVEQKLSLNAANNDLFQTDGVLSAQDAVYDLTEFYDTNKDGNVSREEWVLRWVCAYGDSADFARYVWKEFIQDVERTSIPVNFFDALLDPANGAFTLEDLKATNRERYAAYRAQNADKYIQQG